MTPARRAEAQPPQRPALPVASFDPARDATLSEVERASLRVVSRVVPRQGGGLDVSRPSGGQSSEELFGVVLRMSAP